MPRKDQTVRNPENYVWLKRTGQLWKHNFGVIPDLLGFFGVIVTIPLAVVCIWVPWVRWALLYYWSAVILFGALEGYLQIYRIRCPRCGHNPTRRKNDKKQLSENVLESRLCEMKACPECGYEGRA
jgi:hypothetical protein